MKKLLFALMLSVVAVGLFGSIEPCEAKCRCGKTAKHKVKTRFHKHRGKGVGMYRRGGQSCCSGSSC